MSKEKRKSIIIIILIVAMIIGVVTLVIVKKEKNARRKANMEIIRQNQGIAEEPFLMTVSSKIRDKDNSIIIIGSVDRGTVHVGDKLQVIGLNKDIEEVTVKEIEPRKKKVEKYSAVVSGGGLSIKLDKDYDEIEQGQVLAAPNSIKATQRFEAEIKFPLASEGGRVIYTDTNHEFFIRETRFSGKMELKDNLEKVNPGDTATVVIQLDVPIALQEGDKISIKDSMYSIGTGTVTKVTSEYEGSSITRTGTETGNFFMSIRDIGIVNTEAHVKGTIENGTVKIGDKLQLVGMNRENITVEVRYIQLNQKMKSSAKVGDNVMLTLKDVKSDQVEVGQALIKPDSIKAVSKIEAEIEMSKNSNAKIVDNSTNGFVFANISIDGKVNFESDTKELKGGEKSQATIELDKSQALTVGQTFYIKSNSEIIGKGKIIKIYE